MLVTCLGDFLFEALLYLMNGLSGNVNLFDFFQVFYTQILGFELWLKRVNHVDLGQVDDHIENWFASCRIFLSFWPD